MVFKTVTMSELRKSGGAPAATAMDSHHENIGKGTYNRFQALDPRGRTFSTGKRRLAQDDSSQETVSKAPRLDSNMLFEQMRVHEDKLKNAKNILDETSKVCDEAFQAAHGGIGKCVTQLITVVGLLLAHQEGLSSAVIESLKVNDSMKTSGSATAQGKPNAPPAKKALTTRSFRRRG
jgi:hypothetical protein